MALPLDTRKEQIYKHNNTALTTLIENMTLGDPGLSCQQIHHQLLEKNLKCSTGTIWKIRHELRFHYLPPKIRSKLTEKQKENRIKFALSVLEQLEKDQIIVFTDESRFELNDNKQWIWRRRGDYSDNIFVEKTKFPESLMIFGAISKDFKSKLVFVEDTVTSHNYIHNVIDAEINAALDMKYGPGNYLYMQDGASPHTSKISIRNVRSLFSLLNHWPSGSPDLNPIENIWGVMKFAVSKLRPKTKIELKTIILQVWQELNQNTINACISSFRNRLRLILNNKGSYIQHLVRGYYQDREIAVDFSQYVGVSRFHDLILAKLGEDEAKVIRSEITLKTSVYEEWEDTVIEEQVFLLGKKWQTIGQLLNRSSSSVKARYTAIAFKISKRASK